MTNQPDRELGRDRREQRRQKDSRMNTQFFEIGPNLLQLLNAITEPTPCRDDPHFTGDDPDSLERAAALCWGCAVREECATAGRGEHGVWGGHTTRARHIPTTERARARL